MKSTISFFLMLLLPAMAFCQFNTSIDIVGGPEYSYRLLGGKNLKPIIKIRNEKEVGRLNWRFGLNLNHRLKENFVLKTGLRLAFVGYYEQKTKGIKWGSEFDGMGGWTPDPNLIHEIQIINNHWYLEVPIVGRYEFVEGKFKTFIEVGLSPHYYLNTKKKVITDLSNENSFEPYEFEDFNELQLVGIVSCGANFKLNEKLQFFGQPIFRYHLTRLVQAPIHEHLFNAGIEVGIRKKIGSKP